MNNLYKVTSLIALVGVLFFVNQTQCNKQVNKQCDSEEQEDDEYSEMYFMMED